MPPSPLSASDADTILRTSENRPSLYEGREHNPDGTAHALARHFLITNAGLMKRLQEETRNGAIGYFSAFITRTDMVQAAQRVLNGPAGLWAREQLFDTPANPRLPAGSHTGMRVVINHHDVWTCRVRYAGGGPGVMPVDTFRMLLDRVDDRPHRLHIHTFYPTQSERAPTSHATAKYRNGRQFGRWP